VIVVLRALFKDRKIGESGASHIRVCSNHKPARGRLLHALILLHQPGIHTSTVASNMHVNSSVMPPRSPHAALMQKYVISKRPQQQY